MSFSTCPKCGCTGYHAQTCPDRPRWSKAPREELDRAVRGMTDGSLTFEVAEDQYSLVLSATLDGRRAVASRGKSLWAAGDATRMVREVLEELA